MNFFRNVRNTFLRTAPDDGFWYLENLTFKHLILSKFIQSIYIVSTLYLMTGNVDFRASILQLQEPLNIAWKI